MPKPRTEEQFPLLLVLVGDQDVSHTNKRLFGRGRFDGITSGATAIITEWPNYLSSCWLTALICGITLFIVSVMLTSCLTFQQHPRLPRCSFDYPIIDNRTIHLVHTSHKWSPKQLDLVENITNSFPSYRVHILVIDSKSVRFNEIRKYNRSLRSVEIKKINRSLILNDIKKEINDTIFNETHSAIIKNKTEKTIDDLLHLYPNILITHMTYNDIFENSPLFFSWISMSHQMRIFAARVLQLWQFGGLSFDLLDYRPVPLKRFKNSTSVAEIKIYNYIRLGSKKYEKLNPEVVSVDHNGFHMECKTPCHAFFGKVLMKLRKATEFSTPRGILNGPIYTFCRAGVIDKEFCHSTNILF